MSRALGYGAIHVRIRVSHDRPIETQRELTGMAGFDPYRQGTDPDLIWDFHGREWADLFAVSAKNVPGVVRVETT